MPGRDGERSGTGVSLERHIRAAFTERLGYKAAALFFALVLWLVVSTEEPAEQLVPVRLSLELDPSVELAGERPQLRALVAGRGRTLLSLFDTPPVVRRAFGANAPDSVRIFVRPGDVELPPGIEATVRDVQPRSVLLRFRGHAEPAATGSPAALMADSAVVAEPDALPAESALVVDDSGALAPAPAPSPAAPQPGSPEAGTPRPDRASH
jgi:hypothetical protein